MRKLVGLAALALGLLPGCVPLRPGPPPLPGVSHQQGEQVVFVEEAQTHVRCEAHLHVDVALIGDTQATIATFITVTGNLPGCSYELWSLSAWAVCGPYAPICGQTDLGVKLLEQTVMPLRFARSPDRAHIRVHLQGTFYGITAYGWDDSDQIRCQPGRCLFQAPSPN
jgi:hypothetical protein